MLDLALIDQRLAVETSEQQEMAAALQESEERFRSTFEQAAVGIAHVSLDGQFLRLNQRFCIIAGYAPAKLQALTFQEITHPDDLATDLERVHDLLNGKIQTYSLEKRYIRKDRSLVWINLTVSLVRDPAGEPKYFIAVIEDIDDRKWIELVLRQNEATLKLFVKHAPAEIAMLDANLCYVFASQRWIEAHRLGSVEFITGHSHYELFPEIPERWRQIHQRCLAGAIERCEEDLFEREDGSQEWIRWEIRPWFTGYQTIGGILIFSENITERKQAESNLQASEERLRLALMAANQGIYDINVQTGEVIVNPSYATMLGYDPANFRESTADWAERLHPEDRNAALKHYQDSVAGTVPEYRAEFRLRTRNGNWIWALSMGKIVAWDAAGQPLRMLGTHTDISERKQAEAALSQLAAIVESSADAIIGKTLESTIVSWNVGAENLFGYTAKEAIGQSIFLLIPPERRAEESHILERIRQGELVEHYETVRQHKDGRLIDLSLTISPIRDETGKIVGASKIARDISSRKQVEAERLQANKLRLELQLLEDILEVTFAGYWDWDLPGDRQYLSPTLKRMFGYEDHELPNMPATWQRLVFAEDLPGMMACFNQHIESRGQIPYYNEVRCHHKDGSTVWVICSGRVIEWDQAGHPLRMIGCHLDITERKQTEIQLQASAAELRALFAAMTDTVIVRDRAGRCLKIAPNSSSLYRDSAEMLGRTLDQTIPAPEADLLLTKIHECLDQQTTISAEYSLTIQGSPVYFLANISPLSETTVIIVARDISNLKQIETNLKLYERIIASTKDGIALLDRTYTYQVVNQAYLTWCNKSHTAVVGQTVREVLGSELFDSFIQPRLNQCLAGETIQYEKWFDYPNLGPQFLSVTYVPYLDLNQTIAGVIVSLRDLTDLQQTESSLRISEERLQLALEGSGDGLWDWNMVTGEIYLSPLWQTMLGYAEAELPFNVSTWEQLIHPDDKLWVMNQLNAHLKDSSASYSFDYRLLTKSGAWKWIANYGKVVARDEQGAPLRMVGTHKDISDRKQAEEKLRDLSDRLVLALKSGAIGTWDWDFSHPAYWDDRMYELYGIPQSETAPGFQDWLNFIHPEDRSIVTTAHQAAMQTNEDIDLEFRIIRPDGSVRFLKAYAIIQHPAQDEPHRMVGISYDITDRKQAEQALQELSTAMQNAVEGISRLDINGRYLTINRAYANTCGYEPEELIGQPWQQTVHPDDLPKLIEAYQQMLQSGRVEVEARAMRKDGSTFYKQVTMVTAHDETGAITGHHCFMKDISDRKWAEIALESYAHEVEDLYNNAPCGYHSLDAEGRFVKVNETELRWLGYTREEMLGKPFTDFINAAGRIVFHQNYPKLKQQGWIKDLEYEVVCKDGTQFPVLISATAVNSADGKYLHNRATLYDNRDRKQAEEQLRLSSECLSFANAELARAARLKDEFLAGMSHELRTPLNAVLGLSEALLEEVYGDLTSEQRDSLQLIEKSGQHLLSLINDILDLSKIESGKMELELSTVSVKALCESSLNFVKQQANHKQIKLSCQIAEALTHIEADERRLRQVLVNLLSNAVKFTPDKGCIALRASVDPCRETVEFSITDTGIGIASENMERLFQPFVQLDSSLSRRYEGTGLGLALVRRIMDLHSGSVALESEVGKGSCFTITLPWVPSAHSADYAAHDNSTALQQPDIERALIVEDSETAANQMIRYLTNLGAQAIVHPQGEGALEAAIQTRPSVIILDILLPDQTGWEVLIDLKADLATREIPVVVISVIDDRLRALELGAAEYLLKPITYQQFQDTLSRVVSTSQPVVQTALLLTDRGSLPQPLILLAEDNEANITTTTLYLQAHGVQIVVARNGLEAVQMAQQHQPALILMDIQMPEMDGLEAIRRIRSNTELSQIPIIALTALAMPGDQERCLGAGANEYMTKPVSLRQLFTTISTYVPTLQSQE